jgi:uncharacterized membrane protein YfcA
MTKNYVLYLLLAAFVVLAVWYVWRWYSIERARPSTEPRKPRALDVVLSLVINFFDTLGIGSFAPTTAIFKLQKRMPDEQIPGTLNVGYTLPTFVQAIIFIYLLWSGVDALTLVAMIAAAVLGSWLGAGVVARMPRRAIQIGLGSVLLVAAYLFFSAAMGWSTAGGMATGLTGGRLIFGVCANFVLGALMTIGLGLYGPCLILVSLLGMDPRYAFPIMMGSCAFLMPICSVRFIRSQRYNLRAAIGMAVGAIPGVLVAALIVKSMPLVWLRWLVVVVVLYAATLMLLSARLRESTATAPATSPN